MSPASPIRLLPLSVALAAACTTAIAADKPAADSILDTYADIALAGFEDALATAKALEAYDQMIAEGNADGNAVVQAAIDAPIARTRGIERAVALLKLEGVSIEQSDSLTSPDAVFQ